MPCSCISVDTALSSFLLIAKPCLLLFQPPVADKQPLWQLSLMCHCGDWQLWYTGGQEATNVGYSTGHADSRPAVHDRAFAGHLLTSQPASSKPAHQAQPVSGVHIGPVTAAETLSNSRQQQQQPQAQSQPQANFVKAKQFAGARKGYAYKKGPKGIGYYLDPHSAAGVSLNRTQQAEASASEAPGQEPEEQGVAAGTRRIEDAEDMQPVAGELSSSLLRKPLILYCCLAVDPNVWHSDVQHVGRPPPILRW